MNVIKMSDEVYNLALLAIAAELNAVARLPATHHTLEDDKYMGDGHWYESGRIDRIVRNVKSACKALERICQDEVDKTNAA